MVSGGFSLRRVPLPRYNVLMGSTSAIQVRAAEWQRVLDGEITASALAKELGIGRNTLYRQVRANNWATPMAPNKGTQPVQDDTSPDERAAQRRAKASQEHRAFGEALQQNERAAQAAQRAITDAIEALAEGRPINVDLVELQRAMRINADCLRALESHADIEIARQQLERALMRETGDETGEDGAHAGVDGQEAPGGVAQEGAADPGLALKICWSVSQLGAGTGEDGGPDCDGQYPDYLPEVGGAAPDDQA